MLRTRRIHSNIAVRISISRGASRRDRILNSSVLKENDEEGSPRPQRAAIDLKQLRNVGVENRIEKGGSRKVFRNIGYYRHCGEGLY
mmetsp:Transcript_1938/g.2719  ORF Transcript_1938/g.2719 Transcript_1938/m.2719 type:complete len:87 (-) Transcript_1938:37-297(-)